MSSGHNTGQSNQQTDSFFRGLWDWVSSPSLLALYLLLMLILGSVGARYLASEAPDVWVAKRDLPAFHRLTGEDLRRHKFNSGNLRGRAIPVSRSIDGRYTLDKIAKGKPLRDDQLGPVIEPQTMKGALLVGLSLPSAAVLGGRLQRGDYVYLILRDKNSKNDSAEVLKRVLLLDIMKDGDKTGSTSVVLAFLPPKDDRVVARLAYGEVSLVRAASG